MDRPAATTLKQAEKLMSVGMILGGYVGWWAGDCIGLGLMAAVLVSTLGSITGVYLAWRITTDYLE